MEQLKKNGYATGRGKLIGAHAFGTMNAYAGTDTYTKYNRGNVLLDWRSNPANPKNNPKKPSIEKEKAEEEKEAFEEVIDWIERRVQKFQRLFDKWIKQAETTVTKGFINKYYKKAFKTEKKELDTYGKAYNRYMKEANATGLSKKYRNKVKNGTIDIENIKDEDLANKIQKYQEWYDKAIESTTSFVETAEELYNLPLDKAATKIEKFKDAIDLLDKKLNNAIGHKAKNTLIDQQTREEFKTLNANAKAQKESKKNLKKAGKEVTKNSILNSPDVTKKEKKKIKEAVKNGKEIDISMFKEGSKAYNAAVKYNEALKANKKATQELSMSQEEYNAWLVEASKLKFDNIADDYEKKIQLLDHQMTAVDNRISEIEASGKNVNRSYYDTQKKINAQTRKELMEEKSKLEENLSTIKKGTDEWYDAFDQIQQVSSSISDCEKETYNLNNAINQLHFDLFDDISESISRIITEQEFLQSLFAHEKTTDSETGNFTEAGIAKLGSLSASYHASKNRADKDGEEVKELQRMLDSGSLHSDLLGITFNSMDDLQKKLDETYSKWQNDIKDTYAIETEIADLMKEKYQAELDLLRELIDAKKEALDAEKDLHDYNNIINEKTKDISTIKKQIAAYSGDTSEESIARLQKLRKELDEKQNDLKETEYDRYISDQKDMLDKLYEEYEELVTKKLEDFMDLVRQGLELSNENTSNIEDYLHKMADENNYIIETKGMFDSLSKNIETNVNNIIQEIAKKNADNSGTKPDGQGNAVADSAKPPSPNANASEPPSPNEKESIGNNNSSDSDDLRSQRYLAMDFVAGHLENRKKTDKKKSEYGAVNKKIYENKANLYKGTGKVLKHDELIELAKLLKIKYNNNTKNGNLYKKLQAIKFPGFKKGGVVSVDDIEKQVKLNGDDGIASVKNGESILTPVQTELFQKFTEKMPNLLSSSITMDKLLQLSEPMNNLSAMNNQKYVNHVVNIDNISLPNVNNAKEFAKELLPELQKNKGFENLIGSITSNRVDGFGKFDKYKQIL